jgi:membrane protease subunit HflK
MAWNQPGKGGQGPWRKPSGGGLGNVQDRLRDWFGGPAGGGLGPLGWAGGAVALLLLFNSFKLIDEQQRGVVLRFGAYDRVMGPGANFKWPWPVESVTVVEAQLIQSLEDQVRVRPRTRTSSTSASTSSTRSRTATARATSSTPSATTARSPAPSRRAARR